MYVIEMFENLTDEGKIDWYGPSTDHLFYTFESAEAFFSMFVKYMNNDEQIAFRVYRTDTPGRIKRIIDRE